MNTSCRNLALLCLFLPLAACSIVGGPRESPAIYAPEPRISTDPAWPQASWGVVIAHPGDARLMDGQRIAVSPVPGELQVYRAALWARSPSEMVDDVVQRTLEDSGRIATVARQGSGISANYRLLLDVRTFKSDYAGSATPSAVIEVNAKLLHQEDQILVGSRTFRQAQPASGSDVAQVADAFSQGLGTLGHDIAGWTLQTGQAHQQQAHRGAP